jgi:hypothetical protein
VEVKEKLAGGAFGNGLNTVADLNVFISRNPIWGCGLAHAALDPGNTVSMCYLCDHHVVHIATLKPSMTCMECPFPDCKSENPRSKQGERVSQNTFNRIMGL